MVGRQSINPRKKPSESGYTLIELVLVMALLVLFGIATLSLVVSGSSSYRGIMENKDSQGELRVALSYLDTKIKQNDTRGAIRIGKNPAGDGNALVILENVDGTAYETWIYLSGGILREVLVEKGGQVEDDLGFEIAALEGFSMKYDKESKLLAINVWKLTHKGRQELNTAIVVKSGIDGDEKQE